MKKIILILCLIFIPFIRGMSQQIIKQGELQYSKPFDIIPIVGHVYNENQQPLSGVKVEIRLAYNLEQKRPEIAITEDNEFNTWEFIDWKYLLETVGTTEIFKSVVTNDKGLFRIPGIPIPGAYFLLVRNVENYFPARVTVIIPKTGARNLEVNITLINEKAALESIYSKEALKEIARARKAIKENNIDKAIKFFQNAVEIEPEFAEAHYNLGGLLRQKGKIDESADHFLKAVEFKENYTIALYFLGETLHLQHEYSQSNPHLMKFLKTSSEEESKFVPYVYYLVGANHFHQRQAEEAITFLSKAIEFDPKIHPNAYVFLANSYMLKGDGINAVENFKKFIELYPDASNIKQVKDILARLKKVLSKEKKE